MEKITDNTEENKQNFNFLAPNKPVDLYYPIGYREKEVKDSDMPGELAKFEKIIGQDASRRYNYHFLNEQEIIMANANTFQIINLETKERKIFHGTEIGGIGALTINPKISDSKKRFFAVGECGEWPNIFIYEYEGATETNPIRLYRVLRRGTEKAYSALTFNSTGDKLASVGGDPDYTIVIWNWVNETIILKAKAFSQEIFNVQFYKYRR